MKILAISGSPIANGNIEKAIKTILTGSGVEGEFIKLSHYNIKNCIGCLKCISTNRCVQKDDMNSLLEKIITSDALIIGGFPTFMSLNGLTKTFIERMYPLKHNHMLTKGKLGVVVAGGFRDAEKVKGYLEDCFAWFKMPLVGSLLVPGNAPCLSCGDGETCQYSNVKIMYGPEAKIEKEMFKEFNAATSVYQEAMRIGQELGHRLNQFN